ncbi:MAG TPA: RDD family protein [Dermatophilaceae bacterium]
MTQPAGWYDDPQDPSQLRYWDGIVWSSHVSPKVSPTVAQSTIGMPYGVTPAAARPQSPGSQGSQGARPTQNGFGSPQQGQGQTGGQWPPYGQDPGMPGMPGIPGLGWQSQSLPTTPDGVVLSGWWKRVLARVLDGFITSIVALPLAYVPLKHAVDLFVDFFQKGFADAQAGVTTQPQPSAELTGTILQVSLITLAVYLVYEVAFLTWRGATPGRMAVGISVRLRDKAGPPPLVAVLTRTAVKESGSLFGLLPVVGSLGSVFTLLDSLWPLWDVKKQAIHDKVAATNVVVGSQPKRHT